VTNNLQENLVSALSELHSHFPNDIETLHEAVALVSSSIFRAFGIQCTIVGGQSAAYWMRMPGSSDVDFISQNCGNLIKDNDIEENLLKILKEKLHIKF
jgi:hypothetical protein